MIEESNVIEEE